MSETRELAQAIAKLAGSKAAKATARTRTETRGRVLRVDADGTVIIDAGAGETPATSASVAVRPGDEVAVTITGGRASVTGNFTRPATDDAAANAAQETATKAQQAVEGAFTRLTADEAAITNLKAENAEIATLVAQKADIATLEAGYATIASLDATNATVAGLDASKASVDDLAAANADITALQADTADLATIRANSAKVANLTAEQLEADHAAVGNLDASYAKIDLANVADATIGSALIADAAITEAKIADAAITNAKIGKAAVKTANIEDAAITNALIAEEAVGDAQIIGVSADKLTAGTIDASKITVSNLNAANITTGKLTVGGVTIDVTAGESSIDGSAIEDGTITLSGLSQEVQDEIDGAIETWTVDAVPTLSNSPASGWADDATRKKHVGDVAYVVNAGDSADGYCYRFTYDSTAGYSWTLIKDSDVTKALQDLVTAQGDISGLQSFQSDTTSWRTETDSTLESLTASTTSLATRMDTAEGTLSTKVDTSAFNDLQSTVSGNSSTITTLTSRTDALETDVSAAKSDAADAKASAADSATSAAASAESASASEQKASTVYTAYENGELNGKDGEDGKDASVSVSKSGSTATITATSGDGTVTTATVSDGEQGEQGIQGEKGADGRGVASVTWHYGLSAYKDLEPSVSGTAIADTAWNKAPSDDGYVALSQVSAFSRNNRTYDSFSLSGTSYTMSFEAWASADGGTFRAGTFNAASTADACEAIVPLSTVPKVYTVHFATSGNGQQLSIFSDDASTVHFRSVVVAEGEASAYSDTMPEPTEALPYVWGYSTVAYDDGTSEDTAPAIVGSLGAKGDKGDTPVKGTDYFTGAEVAGITSDAASAAEANVKETVYTKDETDAAVKTAKDAADAAQSTADAAEADAQKGIGDAASAATAASNAQATADAAATETVTVWYASGSTTAPSKPTAQVTATDNATGEWTLVLPDITADAPYLYHCAQNKTSNGYTWGTVYRDYAQTTVTNTVNSVKQTADANSASISTLTETVTDQGTRLGKAETSIGQNASAITLKADASDVYTKDESDENDSTVRSAAIKVAADAITSLVESMDGVTSYTQDGDAFTWTVATKVSARDDDAQATADAAAEAIAMHMSLADDGLWLVMSGAFEAGGTAYIPTADTAAADGTAYYAASMSTSYEAVETDDDDDRSPADEGWYVSDGSGGYAASTDTAVASGTAYYAAVETVSYSAVTPASGDDPAASGWYVAIPAERAAEGYKALLAEDGLSIYDGDGALVATYGRDVDFSPGRGWRVGSDENYISYDAASDSVAIAGSNVSIGGLVNVATALQEAQATADAAAETASTIANRVAVSDTGIAVSAEKGGRFVLQLDSDSIEFIDTLDDDVVAAIEAVGTTTDDDGNVTDEGRGVFSADEAHVERLDMGALSWRVRSNGHLSLIGA